MLCHDVTVIVITIRLCQHPYKNRGFGKDTLCFTCYITAKSVWLCDSGFVTKPNRLVTYTQPIHHQSYLGQLQQLMLFYKSSYVGKRVPDHWYSASCHMTDLQLATQHKWNAEIRKISPLSSIQSHSHRACWWPVVNTTIILQFLNNLRTIITGSCCWSYDHTFVNSVLANQVIQTDKNVNSNTIMTTKLQQHSDDTCRQTSNDAPLVCCNNRQSLATCSSDESLMSHVILLCLMQHRCTCRCTLPLY